MSYRYFGDEEQICWKSGILQENNQVEVRYGV